MLLASLPPNLGKIYALFIWEIPNAKKAPNKTPNISEKIISKIKMKEAGTTKI